MREKLRLVMATNNAGKLREARAIAGDNIEILSLADIGFHHDIPETADTLEGNALLKVRAIKEVCQLDVFADDTGLLVDALGGAPGVYSARYAGEECDPEKNMDLLLRNMEGIEDRRARFRTSIALSLGSEEHLFGGEAEGSIATHRCGTNGFGYDPVFISKETGKCFAEMSDEEKNAISHRSRALQAMMKWLATLCVALIAIIPSHSASASDWTLFNTFGDKAEYVFDTASKTYFLVQAQMYDPDWVDNQDKLCFLFCLDKESDEMRPLNAGNLLSESLIRTAYYNAQKKYLLIVYEDMMIDLLHDDGSIHPIHALKNFDTSASKEVRSISFYPEGDRAYLATDFGFVAINDEKNEVASSGVYGRPIDKAVHVADHLLLLADGKIYRADTSSPHSTFADFEETDWAAGDKVMNLVALSPAKCLISKNVNGREEHYILSFAEPGQKPSIQSIGSFEGADIVENKDGLLLTRTSQIVGLDRQTGALTFIPRSEGNYAVPVGSWDLREVFYAKPYSGFYSEKRNENNEWTRTRQPALPNAPSPFRSNRLAYSPGHGMLVSSHGIDQNFTSHNANNPLLLSAYRQGEWTRHGIPGFDPSMLRRFTNPCGFAQDPDNPDIIYFGSVLNGLMRYNIKDFSSLLHITRSDDKAAMEGHVSAAPPHAFWSNAFMLLYPQFDRNGNLLMTHLNTDSPDNTKYTAELWIWTPEKRRASVSPETFQPLKVLKIKGVNPNKISFALPMESASASTLVNVFVVSKYDEPFVVYDHNGTPDDESDDRQVLVKSLNDQDGSISYHYIYCAAEDPATGLVWVGTDNGVFTFDPSRQFASPGAAQRIKVSRNDGTSLADYLLDGISVNHIAIDSKGRKWFSLNGGGIVCTSADGKSILQEITSDNSMLPSDIVYATCYNPDSNSIMAATKSGLCEYFIAGQNSSGSGTDVRAYPNPVRPDYYGWVTIDGLEDDCLVKITDAAGNVVRELGPASGGKVQWDAAEANLNRVASGVYFVLASSGPGGGSYSEVAKILVMKN